MKKAKVLLGLEDLETSPEFTPEQVTAAEATLDSGAGIQSIYAQFDAVGSMTESGQVVLEVTDRLEQFAEQADEQIRVGNYSPQVVEVFTTGAQNELARVEEDESLPAIESFGSNRVALESNLQTVKDKIKALYEWFLKTIARIRQALVDLFHRLNNEFARVKARAIKFASLARALMDKHARSPRVAKMTFNPTRLGHGSDHSTHGIITGLNLTYKDIPEIARDAVNVGGLYRDEIVQLAKRAETELLPVDVVTRPHVEFHSEVHVLSGGTTAQFKDMSGRIALIISHVDKEKTVDISTPTPVEIDAIARTVVSVIERVEEWHSLLPKFEAFLTDQSKAFVALKHSYDKIADDSKMGYIAQLNRFTVQASRDFQIDLEVHGIRAVLEIAHAANEFTRIALSRYSYTL